MTEYDSRPVSGWAIGGLSFAAVIMIMIGTFQSLAGLAAIINDEYFVVGKNYTYDIDTTAWGWIHMGIGAIAILVGVGLMMRQEWAAVAGIAIAVLSALSNFMFLPYYPLWSIVIIAFDVAIIWALTATLRNA